MLLIFIDLVLHNKFNINNMEQGLAIMEAAEAGASILHLHARDPKDGRPTPDPEVFKQFVPRIAAKFTLPIHECNGALTHWELGSRGMMTSTDTSPAASASASPTPSCQWPIGRQSSCSAASRGKPACKQACSVSASAPSAARACSTIGR